jgi:hypothetical protein
MIPTTIDLSNTLDTQTIEYILMHPTDYFKIADEYVSLQKIFTTETIFKKIELWSEMFISPIIILIQAFFSKQSLDMFSTFSIQKCAQRWKEWFRMRELRSQIQQWITLIRSYGGPFISSNDAEYHVFVYADGMQRLHDAIRLRVLLVSEESTKRFK